MLKYRGGEPMKRQHYFYAIELPGGAKDSLHQWVTELKQTYSYKSWVHPSDYHITLAFLGSASQRMLNDTATLLHTDLKDCSTFPLKIKGLDTFGMEESPRILWASVEAQPLLYELQGTVSCICTKAGFSLDKKSFTPHITIARRCQEKMEKGHIKQIEESLPSISAFEVQNLVLYRTNMDSIPKYEPIVTYPLVEGLRENKE